MRIGFDLAKEKIGINPQDSAAGTVNGGAIDLLSFEQSDKAVALCQCGAASGTPTTQSVTFKLQHCDTSGGTYVDVTDGGADAMTADNSVDKIPFQPSALKRYVRLVSVVAFTGGTTPAIEVAGTFLFDGLKVEKE